MVTPAAFTEAQLVMKCKKNKSKYILRYEHPNYVLNVQNEQNAATTHSDVTP